MAQGVFLVGTKLGDRAVMGRQPKDWIVAKPALSRFGSGNLSFTHPFAE
jgi:hypothetical protein